MSTNQEYLAGEVALWMQRKCGGELEFLGCHNLTGVSVPRGDTNPLYCRVAKNTFEVKRTYRGATGLGAATLVARDTILNIFQEIGCAVDVYAMHAVGGADENPTNYDYLYLYRGFELTSEDTDPHSIGIDPDANTRVMMSMPSTFQGRLKVKKLTAQEVSLSSLSTVDFNSVMFCDPPSCDSFGRLNSIGCQLGYILTDGPTAQLLKTTNGGGAFTAISSPFTDASHPLIYGACREGVLIVLNGTATEYAYSWDDADSFTVVTTPTQLINRVRMFDGVRVWFVAQGGEIYKSTNRGASISTALAGGDVTSQSLNDIAAADSLLMYAVGDNNTFLRSVDGGIVWSVVTGPAASIFPNDLYRVTAIPGTNIVMIGDEQGNVYRSEDQGDAWTTVLALTSMAGGIMGIAAPDCNVLLVIGNDQDPYFYAGAATGVAYQSVDGGNSWTAVVLPANTGLNDIFACDINRYWIVGEGGFAAKIAGPVITTL